MLQPEDEAALEEFGSRFRGVKFYKGMPLAFTTAGHGKLTTRIDEKEVGVRFPDRHDLRVECEVPHAQY